MQSQEVRIDDVSLDSDAIARAMDTEYGHLTAEVQLPLTSGPFKWEVGSPTAVLKAYMQSAALSPFVADVLQHRGLDPRYPLRLLFYCDELTQVPHSS